MTQLRAGSATDVGRVRTNNEDNLLVADDQDLYAVADGMGGHAGGEVASLAAVEALRSAYNDAHTADALADAVRHANRVVWERAGEDATLRGMGTTLTAIALVDEGDDEVLAVVNVGDSRAYLIRDGELDQLTDDHSLAEEFVRRGEITREEASTHPQKHILTRALGIDADVEVDCFRVVPYRGDRILLASDGLFDELSDDKIASVLRRLADPEEAAKELVSAAKQSGGRDNITVVVVDVVDDDDRAASASAALKDVPRRESRAEARIARDEEPTEVVGAVGDEPEEAEPRVRPALTGRIVAFVVALLVIVGGVVLALGYYSRGMYFVGLDDSDEVVIFKGRPGGLLWFDPTLEARTGIVADEVPPARLEDVREGHEVSSLEAAERYIGRLREEREALAPPPAAPLPPPDATATTAPPPTAPPPPP